MIIDEYLFYLHELNRWKKNTQQLSPKAIDKLKTGVAKSREDYVKLLN